MATSRIRRQRSRPRNQLTTRSEPVRMMEKVKLQPRRLIPSLRSLPKLHDTQGLLLLPAFAILLHCTAVVLPGVMGRFFASSTHGFPNLTCSLGYAFLAYMTCGGGFVHSLESGGSLSITKYRRPIYSIAHISVWKS